MGELTEAQLETIERLNNLKAVNGCPHGCIQLCRRATEAAKQALQGNFKASLAEYNECQNGLVITLTMQTLADMSGKQ